MSVRFPRRSKPSRAAAVIVLLASAAGVSGCAQIGDTMSPAFADPAKYDLYDCKQLETERKSLATSAADQEKLMAKAETGVGGTVVSEMVYRNELISIRARQKLADQAWRSNKCHESPPDETAAAAAPAAPAPAAKGARAPRGVVH
ncbi:twin-arginine translocation pathway signal [Bradyrhizobium septentrionale]|uniref:Twin-arginine translocation pathway signal n=1 Tax=Bradyrhizobium septentrionale TaxID=1404411 RepID=A0A973W4B2_9BRAD|nr:twin-arginine translocation pathway signal [Bradyrhizobium septentrionale]UGY15688.1 twin-arginine translocation pathway signal [Bradyrhizobium septentrionale]UGY24262.1 twin-arginine translocation pathway signal [Bradyrhizobium septentrionale]